MWEDDDLGLNSRPNVCRGSLKVNAESIACPVMVLGVSVRKGCIPFLQLVLNPFPLHHEVEKAPMMMSARSMLWSFHVSHAQPVDVSTCPALVP